MQQPPKYPVMDDNDLVFVPSSCQSDGDGSAIEVFEDFVDLKDATEAKPEEAQVFFLFKINDHITIITSIQLQFFLLPHNASSVILYFTYFLCLVHSVL